MLLLMPLVAQGQPVLAPVYERTSHTYLTSDVEKTLTRKYRCSSSINYIETSTMHYFLYYDSVSATAVMMSFTALYSVNDFRIASDTVFMCGTTTGGEGFVGFFDIQDYFFNAQTCYLTTTAFASSLGVIERFDKMVVYSVGSERRMAIIGQGPLGYYCVAEMVCDFASSPLSHIVSYQLGVVPISYDESMLDIALTDNYVVTTGFTPFGTAGNLCMRVYNKNDMFATGGPQNKRSEFAPNDTVVSTFDASQVVTAHMLNDIFAVAAYWRGTNSTHNEGTYLGYYGINNALLGQTSSTYIVQDYINGDWKLRGLTAYDTMSYLYLLQNAELLNIGDVSMVFELTVASFNYSSSSSTPTTFLARVRDDAVMQGIDASSCAYGYIANGSYVWDPYRLEFETGSPSFYRCTLREVFYPQDLPITNKGTTYPLTMYVGGGMQLQPSYGNQITSQIGIECIEQ